LLSNRDDRILQQRVEQANQEIIYAVRPSLSQGTIPSRDIIDALIRSFARKYHISPKLLATVQDVCDDLTREIMDTDFIESERKAKLCGALLELGAPDHSQELESSIIESDAARSRRSLLTLTSAYMGLVTGLMTTVLAVFWIRPGSESLSDRHFVSLFLPLIVSLVAILLAVAGMMVTREIMRRSRRPSLQNTARPEHMPAARTERGG
jgi:uncharacterized protein YacL